MATAAFLKEQAAGCSAFVIGEAGLLNALYDVGITMNDVNPVSYTHLDVYKRQLHWCRTCVFFEVSDKPADTHAS